MYDEVYDARDETVHSDPQDISFFTRAYTDADSGCVSYNSIVLSPSCEGL